MSPTAGEKVSYGLVITEVHFGDE